MQMNYQVPSPTTAQQLQEQQLMQALQAQPSQTAAPAPGAGQINSPWQGAAQLISALTSPASVGPGGSSSTPLQNLSGLLGSAMIPGDWGSD